MIFSTQVQLPLNQLTISHKEQIMMIGSCFAQNIGGCLADNRFNVLINPFGILYNPVSIAQALEQIMQSRIYTAGDTEMVFHDGLWHSMMHHGSFSSPSQEVCLTNINHALRQASDTIKRCDILILTLGTAFVYRHKSTGRVAGNCHKIPSTEFSRELLSVDEAADVLQAILERLFALRPNIKVLFTVSPIRHIKEGAVESQISKSTLLLAVNRLRQQQSGRSFYFPAYEIMMDELRDYRYYADDMVHPSPLAINYLWECFQKSYFGRDTMQLLDEWNEIRRGLSHRPINPDNEQYRLFKQKLVLKIEAFRTKSPYFDLENELKKLKETT